jgi:hypothetical protein
VHLQAFEGRIRVRHPKVFNGKLIAAAIICCAGASILMAGMGQDQDLQARRREELASPPKVLPTDLMQQVKALGARMRTSGKEESAYDGQFVDGAGREKRLHVVHQISGELRIESPDEKSELSFDGDAAQGIKDRNGESLVDTFVLDTPEGMVYAFRNGASAQLLGRGFAADSSRPDSNAPHYDVYEITAPERTHKGSAMRVRRYYFDSETGLLASTRYTDRSGVAVETRFLGWGQIEGSAYPSRIERYEDGHLAFAFVAGSITGRSKPAKTNSK